MQIRYDPKLKALARELRNNSTLGEILLWRHLKGKQRRGYDFHRQKPVHGFIVDFFAPRLALAVELDGGSHRLKVNRDETRQRVLEDLGIRFLRFSEAAVRQNPEGIAVLIDQWIDAHAPVPPAG